MKPKNKNPPKDQKPSQNRANQHARKNQRNQKKNQKKTAAKRSKKKATPLTPEEKEYRVQKKLRAPTQVGVRKLILAFPTYVSHHYRQADRIAARLHRAKERSPTCGRSVSPVTRADRNQSARAARRAAEGTRPYATSQR